MMVFYSKNIHIFDVVYGNYMVIYTKISYV